MELENYYDSAFEEWQRNSASFVQEMRSRLQRTREKVLDEKGPELELQCTVNQREHLRPGQKPHRYTGTKMASILWQRIA
ncbi:MAG: hypothetical protein CVU38_10855 [Chloroflexi bacterium HGW-Chloroflexi-1]|nr:MAG: hypothetical protein CVU38_10855 [Chloroflexi bacterium HGW-Chloroflexi-1]